jgi:hypothetical protein
MNNEETSMEQAAQLLRQEGALFTEVFKHGSLVGPLVVNVRWTLDEKFSMKLTFFCLLALTILASSCSHKSKKYPGKLVLYGFHIGDQLDTTRLKKLGNNYLPNHIDWSGRENGEQSLDQHSALPMAIWESGTEKRCAFTLLGGKILNIAISGLRQSEKDSLSKIFAGKFGIKGTVKVYESPKPGDDLITYWDLKTWETDDVILEMGKYETRLPANPPYEKPIWSLIYSDLILEKAIIEDFVKKHK